MGRLEEALRIERSVVARYSETGNIRSEGSSWRNVGYYLIDLGRIDQAEKALDAAYRANTAAGDLVGQAKTSAEHGYALLRDNQYSSARRFLLRALDEWIACGAPQGPVSSIIGWLAQAAKGEDRTELARQLRGLRDEFMRVSNRLSRGGRNDLELAKMLRTRTELALAVRAMHAAVLKTENSEQSISAQSTEGKNSEVLGE
jgi:tetratricopeptide (TPR) repeat protein